MPLKLVPTTPKKSLNAAFLKVREQRGEIVNQGNMNILQDIVEQSERENYIRNPNPSISL